MTEQISVTEAAKLRGSTVQNIRSLIARGVLPATKVGAFWVIARADFEALRPRRKGK